MDSCGRNIKAVFVCVKCVVREASFITVNYTLTQSHSKHSPSLSFSLSPLQTLIPCWEGGLDLFDVSFESFRGLFCVCVPARPFRSSPSSEPHLPPWTHSLPGPAFWLVVWRRGHSPSSTPSSFVSQMVHFHLHVQLLLGLPGETPPLECALHRDPLINPCVLFSVGWVIALLFLPPYWSSFICSWFSGPAYRNHFPVSVIIRVRWC